MKLVLYEDKPEHFFPLTMLSPQFALRIGMGTSAEYCAQHVPHNEVGFVGREVFRFKNIGKQGPCAYVSSRALITRVIKLPAEETRLSLGSEIVGFVKYAPPFPQTVSEIEKTIRTIKRTTRASGFVLHHIWDFIKYNEQMLRITLHRGSRALAAESVVTGSRTNVLVAQGARIHALVSIDTTHGPVYIDEDAEIRPFTTIIGPCYIGKGTIVDQAKISTSSIGPFCRISGEVETCIVQGYSNKHHEGFLGHSFVGSWVNLGALTTNSDLKNNYGSVRIVVGTKKHDSGMIKLGCFIGDHTKLGIGTLIPTGAVIGSFVNFWGGGMMPQYVPSFSWLTQEAREDYRLDKAIQTAKVVMKRRHVRLSKQYEGLIRTSHRWRTLSSQ